MRIVDWVKHRVAVARSNKVLSKLDKLLLYFYDKLVRLLRFWQSTASICWERDIFTLAQSLSYVTVLSLVPIFIIFFFIIGNITKNQEYLEYMVGLISKFFLPDFTGRLIQILQDLSTQAVGLGLIGFPTLLVVGVFLYVKVDKSINKLWSSLDTRGIFQNFSAFINSALIGPVLIVLSLSIPTYIRIVKLENIAGDATAQFLESFILAAAPFLSTIATLTMLYFFVPVEKVKFKSALIGAFWITLLLKIFNYLLEIYISNFTKYDAIYGSLSTLPVLMLWLYVMWLAILFGSVLAYVHQTFSHRKFIITGRSYVADSNLHIAYKILLRLCYNQYHREPLPDLLSLCYEFNFEKQSAQAIVKILKDKKIINQINEKNIKSRVEVKYQLSSSPDLIKLKEINDIFKNKNINPSVPAGISSLFKKLDSLPLLDWTSTSLFDLYKLTENMDLKRLNQNLQTITIQNLTVECFVGVNDYEKNVKQPLIIDLDIEYEVSDAVKRDDIAYGINYSTLSKGLKNYLESKSYNLLESFADDIINFLKQNPQILKAKLKINKPKALDGIANISISKQIVFG